MTGEWSSGFYAECTSCGRFTIVRDFGDDVLDVPTEDLCKPCYYSDDDDEVLNRAPEVTR